jgi:hypothetical protein
MNIVSGMAWPWFGPIANNSLFANQMSLSTANKLVHTVVKEFGFTLDEVNWLGNIVACVSLPAALITPTIISRYGIRKCVRRFQFHALAEYCSSPFTVRYRGRDITYFCMVAVRWDITEPSSKRLIYALDNRAGVFR